MVGKESGTIFFWGNECLFIGESRTMQVYAAKTVYKAGFAIGQNRAGLSSMMFARIFMIILMVGGCGVRGVLNAEPARILRNECGVPTKTDLGGYFDCVWVEWDIFDMYELCLKHCKALDYITFNTNNSTLREFYCQEAQKALLRLQTRFPMLSYNGMLHGMEVPTRNLALY